MTCGTATGWYPGGGAAGCGGRVWGKQFAGLQALLHLIQGPWRHHERTRGYQPRAAAVHLIHDASGFFHALNVKAPLAVTIWPHLEGVAADVGLEEVGERKTTYGGGGRGGANREGARAQHMIMSGVNVEGYAGAWQPRTRPSRGSTTCLPGGPRALRVQVTPATTAPALAHLIPLAAALAAVGAVVPSGRRRVNGSCMWRRFMGCMSGAG